MTESCNLHNLFCNLHVKMIICLNSGNCLVYPRLNNFHHVFMWQNIKNNYLIVNTHYFQTLFSKLR